MNATITDIARIRDALKLADLNRHGAIYAANNRFVEEAELIYRDAVKTGVIQDGEPLSFEILNNLLNTLEGEQA